MKKLIKIVIIVLITILTLVGIVVLGKKKINEIPTIYFNDKEIVLNKLQNNIVIYFFL